MDAGSWGVGKLEMGSLKNGSAIRNGDWGFLEWKEMLLLVSESVVFRAIVWR